MTSSNTTAIIIWGTQLTIEHHSALHAFPDAPVFMIESKSMCAKYKFHKQKLAFVLTAMREYADELRKSGRTVHYVTLNESDTNWFNTLGKLCGTHGIISLVAMRQNDRSPQLKLEQWCKDKDIALQITPNTLFLTLQTEFEEWASAQNSYRMEHFYRWQRKRLDILMQPDGKPEGDRWNYDSDNRKPLPKDITLPDVPFPAPTKHRADVITLIDTHFSNHPGSYEINWIPTTRAQAKAWLDEFIAVRLELFGDYEDAMMKNEVFLYHSALSPLLNIGLLHPSEVVEAAIKSNAPIASKEGFVRQVIGWREFIFGMYHFKDMSWKEENFFEHVQPMPTWWWKFDNIPEPPLEDLLARLHSYGYSHHIERLMVLGNYMLLSQYKPREVYDWFMTMYVDAYEWVMVPNIYGMSQYADGGMQHGGFATKPYISGSNYLQKMGKWWPTGQAAKDSDWTKLYWQFLARNEERLTGNYRLQPLFKAARKYKNS